MCRRGHDCPNAVNVTVDAVFKLHNDYGRSQPRTVCVWEQVVGSSMTVVRGLTNSRPLINATSVHLDRVLDEQSSANQSSI